MNFKSLKYLYIYAALLVYWFVSIAFSQEIPSILKTSEHSDETYLPDFSYAGYTFGEKQIPVLDGKVVKATDYGVIADDGLDDSKALLKALAETNKMEGNIILQLPKGKLIVSDIPC